MVNDKTQFKRLVFTLVTLSLAILVVMASVGLLSWFAGLPDWGNSNYRSFLAIEIILVSFATVLFVFYRKPSLHPFERPLPAQRHLVGKSDASKRVGWWTLWLLAWLMLVIPTGLQFYESKSIGVVRAALALWWLMDLLISGYTIFSQLGKQDSFHKSEPKP
ncbi:MAG: hypothetical protein ACKO3V_12110, partial [Pirellula sp.]